MKYDDVVIKMAGMYLERAASHRFESLFDTFPVVVVCGARQVGKSTLVQHLLTGKAEFVVFDPVVDVENARQDPQLFFSSHRTPLVLDEIQYAPEVLPTLKRLIDRDRHPGQYVLTGSQQWGVLKSVADSLAGRAVFLDLDGLSLSEVHRLPERRSWMRAWLESPQQVIEAGIERIGSQCSLYDHLWRGWLPESLSLTPEVIPDFHMAYHRTYIERDARLLAEVSDWQQFGRFMRLVSALTAQEVNYSQLGREIGITPQTSGRWLNVLKATFQWFEVPAFSGNTIKRVSSKPKGHIGDSGVACWSLAISTPRALSSHPHWGSIFETAVYGEVRKSMSLLSPPATVYHWRSHAGAEVDLLLERDGGFFPVEVKGKANPSGADTSGITAFRKTYPHLHVHKGLVVAPCESFQRISENDYAMPWDGLLPE